MFFVLYEQAVVCVFYVVIISCFLKPLVLTITGGGAQKVVKHTIKAKAASRVTAQDIATFNAVHATCMQIHGAGTFSLRKAIEEMGIEEVADMKEYLKKDKTTTAIKLSRLHEQLRVYSDLRSTQDKLTLAMEHFKTLVGEDLVTSFGDEDGNMQMDALREFVSNTLAVKRAQAHGSSVMRD